LSSGTYVFAKATKGSTITTIEKKVDVTESASTTSALKAIVIDETVAGTIEKGEIKLRLGGEFKFASDNVDLSDVAGRFVIDGAARLEDDKETLIIPIKAK